MYLQIARSRILFQKALTHAVGVGRPVLDGDRTARHVGIGGKLRGQPVGRDPRIGVGKGQPPSARIEREGCPERPGRADAACVQRYDLRAVAHGDRRGAVRARVEHDHDFHRLMFEPRIAGGECDGLQAFAQQRRFIVNRYDDGEHDRGFSKDVPSILSPAGDAIRRVLILL